MDPEDIIMKEWKKYTNVFLLSTPVLKTQRGYKSLLQQQISQNQSQSDVQHVGSQNNMSFQLIFPPRI